jgi:hypothetical protein
MSDVGLASSAQRLKEEYKVVIKYTIEIEGLPVTRRATTPRSCGRKWRPMSRRYESIDSVASNV